MTDKDYWDRHARNYDASLRWLLGRPMPRMLELVSEAVSDMQKVLEVGAGTGIVTEAIARTSGRVVATDYAPAMLELLKQRVSDAEFKNVICERVDIYALPYREGEFDAVVAANVLHLVPDLPAALEALRKVVKPDGVLVLPTFCHDETKLSWAVSRLLAVSGFPGHRRFSARSLHDALKENGIQIVREELLPGMIPIGFFAGSL